MKKTLITAGAASLALAAMPIVGVFAADGTLSQTDTVVLTVQTACSLASSGSNDTTYTTQLTPGGNDQAITGSTFTVTCNDAGGWALYAVGNSDATTKTSMDSSTNVDGDDIVTGTTLNGSVSNWAFKLAAGTESHAGAAITTGYTGFSAIPATQTKVASNATGSERTTSATVTATYGVGVSSTQATGTYTGKVLYTLVHPATTTAPAEP